MVLSARITRLLAAMGIFKEAAKDSFQPTALSNACVSSSPFSAGIVHMYAFIFPGVFKAAFVTVLS